MHTDIEGATRIARIAAEFDWKWPLDDPTRSATPQDGNPSERTASCGYAPTSR